MTYARLLFVLVLPGLVACRGEASGAMKSALAEREKAVEQRISEAANAEPDTPLAKWILPDVLREVSGLALTKDGRVLAHNDERGRVYVIDPKKGVILKYFSLGEKGVVADFEAIAVSGDDIFMLTSNGHIYQFREGADRENVKYTKHDTKLGKECEFESLEVDPAGGGFILVCKQIDKKSDRNQLLIYRWTPRAGGTHAVARMSVPLADVIAGTSLKAFSPSDMTIDPKTGNYVIISGREKSLVEITPQGRVVRSVPLPGNPQQPEGVAITADGIMMIGDEGVTRSADITLYPWRALEAAPAAEDSIQTQPANPPVR